MEHNLEELSGFLIDIAFASHEEMSEMAKLWDLEQIQIEKGSFTGSIHGIHTPHIQIAESVRSHGVAVKGKIPSNTYMFAFVSGVGEITHNGIPLSPNELLVLDDKHELDFTSKGSSMDVSIVIDKTFFENTYKTLFGVPFAYKSNSQRIELVSTIENSFKNDFERWRHYLVQNRDEWINDHKLTEEIEKSIIETLCSYLGIFKDHKLLSSEKDAIALHQYIDKNYTEDITIKEICKILNISERGVRPSFKNIFGLNPKAYLSRYRLGKFRNSLLKNPSNPPYISEICYNEGLFHSGRLPAEYKDMFGYLPSDIPSKKKTSA